MVSELPYWPLPVDYLLEAQGRLSGAGPLVLYCIYPINTHSHSSRLDLLKRDVISLANLCAFFPPTNVLPINHDLSNQKFTWPFPHIISISCIVHSTLQLDLAWPFQASYSPPHQGLQSRQWSIPSLCSSKLQPLNTMRLL